MKLLLNSLNRVLDRIAKEIKVHQELEASRPKSKIGLRPAAQWPFPTGNKVDVPESNSSKLARAERLIEQARSLIEEVS